MKLLMIINLPVIYHLYILDEEFQSRQLEYIHRRMRGTGEPDVDLAVLRQRKSAGNEDCL